VQNFGSSRDVLIRVPLVKDGKRQGRRAGDGNAQRWQESALARTPELKRVEFVGPQVGKELAEDGALACCW
jgi:preprotein translocase subunit SecF